VITVFRCAALSSRRYSIVEGFARPALRTVSWRWTGPRGREGMTRGGGHDSTVRAGPEQIKTKPPPAPDLFRLGRLNPLWRLEKYAEFASDDARTTIETPSQYTTPGHKGRSPRNPALRTTLGRRAFRSSDRNASRGTGSNLEVASCREEKSYCARSQPMGAPTQ